MNSKYPKTISELADIIFDIIPEDIQKQYEKNVFGRTLTLKDQFIAYCYHDYKFVAYSKEKTINIAKKLVESNGFDKEKIETYIFNKFVVNFGDWEKTEKTKVEYIDC